MRRRLVFAPWVWGGAVVVAGAVFMVVGGHDSFGVGFGLVFVGILLAYAVLASLIAVRQPGNAIAWLLLITGVFLFVQVTTTGALASWPLPGSRSAWYFMYMGAYSFVGLFFFYPLSLLFFIFPSGDFLTRRWRWPVWIGAISGPLLVLVLMFSDRVGPVYGSWKITNPIGFLPAQLFDLVLEVIGGINWVLAIGGVVALVVRFRRSSEVVRAQVKWVVFAAVLFVPLFVIVAFAEDSSTLFGLAFLAVLLLIPGAITVAITRYRLFEIDRIISRTVGYALVVAALGLVYVAGAVWLPTKLLGEQPPLFVAGSTLVVAALFNPVRRRVLSWVDRRFNRSQYDAQQVVDSFVDRLQDGLDVGQLTAESVAVVTRVMQPDMVGVWVQSRATE